MSCFSPQASPAVLRKDEYLHLAALLSLFAENASVRELEALAAVHCNRCRAVVMPNGNLQNIELDEICWSARTPARHLPKAIVGEDDPVLAMCQRIAKRACCGTLKDPTKGATRFHLVSDFPAWALGRSPSAWIGEYLFYP